LDLTLYNPVVLRYPVRSVVEKEEADRTAATQAPDFIDFPETLGTTPSESITQQTNGLVL